MKARFNGIEVEGTPEEMASLIKAMGEAKKAETIPNPWRDVTPPNGTTPVRDYVDVARWLQQKLDSQKFPQEAATLIWYNTGK